MGSDVMVQLYVPQKEKFYFNFSLLIIWLIAMISVSLGGTYKHLRINM